MPKFFTGFRSKKDKPAKDAPAVRSPSGGKSAKSRAQSMHVSDSPEVYVGDTIRIRSKREGKVTCIGPKPDRNGVWVRVVVDSYHNSFGNVHEQSTNESRQRAVWIPMRQVDRVVDSTGQFHFTVGDRVRVPKKKASGTVRYVGPTQLESGVVSFGIEFDDTKGKHNGTVKGKYYFQCKKNTGIFIHHQNQLEHEEESHRPHSKSSPSKPGLNKSPKPMKSAKNGKKSAMNGSSKSNGTHNTHDDSPPPSPKAMNGMNGKRKNYHNGSSDEDHGDTSPKKKSKIMKALSGKRSSKMDGNKKKKTPRERQPLEGFKPLFEENSKACLSGVSLEMYNLARANNVPEKPRKRKITLKGLHKELYESKLPLLSDLIDSKSPDLNEVFKKKLRLCRAICQFSDLTKVKLMMIEKKEKILTELSDFIARQNQNQNQDAWFGEEQFRECLKTIEVNLFRTLPYQFRPPTLSFFNDEVFDKDTNFEDPAWRHLKLVYDLTWRVINTPQVTAAMMETYMAQNWLHNLIELFASEDHRERAYLMMISHKIYGRCLNLRPTVIDLICSYLYRMIYTDDFNHVNGIIELLQIICAIIPGLTVPVKDSWQNFLRNVLVPLHKCRGLKKFWEQLTQCCVNYVAKDGTGGAVILGGLLKYWPKQSPQKEEIFIMEVVNIINVLINHQAGFEYEQYKDILVAASHRLTECMLSTRQPVAERAIAAWKEQSMQHLVDYDRKAFLPKLAEAFYRNRNHHNQPLRMSSNNVEKIYQLKDKAYWKKMQLYLAKKEKREKEAEEAASRRCEQGLLPDFPFVPEKRSKNTIADEDQKDEENSERLADSFAVYMIDYNSGIDYGEVLEAIQHTENDPAKQKKKKHYTPTEVKTKRRAYWSAVRQQAEQNADKWGIQLPSDRAMDMVDETSIEDTDPEAYASQSDQIPSDVEDNDGFAT